MNYEANIEAIDAAMRLLKWSVQMANLDSNNVVLAFDILSQELNKERRRQQ